METTKDNKEEVLKLTPKALESFPVSVRDTSETDKGRYIRMLNDFGIEFKEELHQTRPGVTNSCIIVEEGYTGFVFEFEFTPDGKYVTCGAYE